MHTVQIRKIWTQSYGYPGPTSGQYLATIFSLPAVVLLHHGSRLIDACHPQDPEDDTDLSNDTRAMGKIESI